MTKWCPSCRSEYVEGWRTCSNCGAELVTEPPERSSSGSTSFAHPEHEDPWVPIWEGPTIDAEGLVLVLEGSHIPVGLGEALEVGHARVEVPGSYVAEASDVIEGRAAGWPSGVAEEVDGGLDWSPHVRVVLAVVAVGLLILLLLV